MCVVKACISASVSGEGSLFLLEMGSGVIERSYSLIDSMKEVRVLGAEAREQRYRYFI